jgi:hypothetical protein
MSYPQTAPKYSTRPKLTGVPELSKFRCEIYLNERYSTNKVSLLDGYSTMRQGENIHTEAVDIVDCLTSFARRLVANGYFQYEVQGTMRVYRATAINFFQQTPHHTKKTEHVLVMQMTPHEAIMYGYYSAEPIITARINELYEVIRTDLKRRNYGRQHDERKDFTFKGKTYDDLTRHCKELTEVKKYDRARVVAFWRTMKNQYFPNYEATMTTIQNDNLRSDVGYPEQVTHIVHDLTRKFSAK